MINWKLWENEPNDKNLNDYPTILDIVDGIIQEEERLLTDKYPLIHNHTSFTQLERPGRYVMMSPTGDNNTIELLPTSKSRMTYYRGQSCFFSPCKPSLFRDEDNIHTNILISRLQIAELFCCMRKHPVIWDIMLTRLNFENKLFNVPIPIHFEGLAQHYGIKTSFLDITADKWAAAFFAITKNERGRYIPIDTNNSAHPKYGVFYRYSWRHPNGSIHSGEVHAIGLHYFNRPGAQSALVIHMKDNDDFNVIEGVEKIFFRQDNDATKLVYDLCQQGRRFFPEDSLSSVISDFIKVTKISKEAVLCCNEIDFPFVPHEKFVQWILENGITITEVPQIKFNQETMQQEYNEWTKEGKRRFLDKIFAIPILKMPMK